MKHTFFLCCLAVFVAFVTACSQKEGTDPVNEEVSIIGEWHSYEYWEMDETATYATGKEKRDTFCATFTETDAIFTDNGTEEYRSTYSKQESNPNVFIFTQAYEEHGVKIIAQLDGSVLVVTIGGDGWDWVERYFCVKNSK